MNLFHLKQFSLFLAYIILSVSGLAQTSTSDPHSYAQPDRAVVTHLALNLTVNFQKKVLTGKASWKIKVNQDAGEIVFDTRDLEIRKVTLGDPEKLTTFTLGKNDDFLGKPLTVKLTPGTTVVNIYYTTSPGAAALQWLTPQQTGGKMLPFLFTQSQAILARTWIPCQDGPGIRFTYEADVKVPPALLPLMSASNPQQKNKSGKYHFNMAQPIPSYLLALAVGDIAFRKLSENTGVYAEPAMLEKVAWEFADIPAMVAAAERLYGPYRWDRYDVIVLPPSFPFGGMENPRLTFATPTVIAGDRSLVSLVSHELAHSWSGNLVTNATWDDFWLNEGFTVYFERRIDEQLYGKEFADMEWVLGRQSLADELNSFGEDDRDTWLKLDLSGRDPDDGMTGIAYEKGALLLHCIEERVGREKLDSFLMEYFSVNAFQSMTTESFVIYLENQLIATNKTAFQTFDYKQWIYGAGIPESCPPIISSRFELVDVQITAFNNGGLSSELQTKNWVAQEWIHFLSGIQQNLSSTRMKELDDTFDLTNSGNSEIAVLWFLMAINNQYTAAYPQMESFLNSVGRRKFIMPLYQALMQTEAGKQMAMAIYKKSRQNYHPVATGSVDELLQWKEHDNNSPY
jgi:leukotriene-A4 hydrolase